MATDEELIGAFNRLQQKLDKIISENIELSEQIEMLQKENYQLSLQAVEKLKEQNNQYRNTLEWLLKQQYYILNPNIKKKIRKVLDLEESEVQKCET